MSDASKAPRKSPDPNGVTLAIRLHALLRGRRRGPDVSKGGNEIVVEEHGGQRFVFFYTYRGILSHYSGYLFVPTGADPRSFRDAADRRIAFDRRSANWYFLTHW
jgi:hypothetical protein